MEKVNLIAPSLLAADFSNLKASLAAIEKDADWLHFDVMDGHFVPNLSFGPHIAREISKFSLLPQDVHLMVEHPLAFIEPFIKAGAMNITVHVEAKDDVDECLDKIHSFGAKASVVLNPDTPAERVFPYLEKADMVLQMTVFPGFGGQSFIASALENVRRIRERVGEDYLIQVDGGVTADTFRDAMEAGANVMVAGTAVFRAADPAAVCRILKGRNEQR